MKSNKLKGFLSLMIILGFAVYFAACNDNSITSASQTDEGYIKEVINSGYGAGQQEEDDVMSGEVGDLDDGGPVADGSGDTPIDSLYRWGRKVTNVNVDVNIQNSGDTMKTAVITRTISGNFIIVGTVNGVQNTISKPYTEVTHRTAIFKRVARTDHPRFNWRLYQVTMLDGGSTAPQVGENYVKMTKIEVYKNGNLAYTFNGPDFTQNVFTTRGKFGGTGIPEIDRGDNVTVKVYAYSTQPDKDIVAWHNKRNTFGFHRIPFDMVSETPNGAGWDRVYQKNVTVNGGHMFGKYNGFISASTHKSLYDDSPAEFASDLAGIPYRVDR